MQGGNNRAATGGANREMPAVGAPPGAAPHLMFSHAPMMMPPGLPLPMGGPFPGGVPPALLPGAFALHHAAVAGAAAGAAAAAEEARKARERAAMNSAPNDGSMPAGGPGGPLRGGRGGGPRGSAGKRHGMERTTQSWRRQVPDESPASAGRPQKGRGEWRGAGGRAGVPPGCSRWRTEPTDCSTGTTTKRQRVVDGAPRATSDSELSLMSVASDEQHQNRRSPSVEFVHRQGPSRAPPLATTDNTGELSAVLTPMSSLSRSSRESSLSRASSPSEGNHSTRRGPIDLAGTAPGNDVSRLGETGVMPEWPPGLGGPMISQSRPSPGYRTRSPTGDISPGCASESAPANPLLPQHAQKRSPPKRTGKFLFDLWVPTTFHPLGRDAIKAVLGVRGSTHKEMERVAGAHVQIYGKKLNRNTKKHEYDEFRYAGITPNGR